jgi:hypothetical protein
MALMSIIQSSLTVLVLGVALALVGLMLLREYAKLLRHDPKATMSVEVIFMLITQTGAPGYLAAFLLSAAILCGISALLMLVFNVSSYLGLLGSAQV